MASIEYAQMSKISNFEGKGRELKGDDHDQNQRSHQNLNRCRGFNSCKIVIMPRTHSIIWDTIDEELNEDRTVSHQRRIKMG